MHSEAGLTLIVAWKAVKALTVLPAGIALLSGSSLTGRIAGHLRLPTTDITLAGAALLLLAVLYTVEAVGLHLRRRWAAWLTLVPTAALIPIESWRIVTHREPLAVLVLVGNIGVVWYLATRLRTATFPLPRP